MANASARKVSKTRQVTETYTVRDGVILELSEEEAAFLTAMLGKCVIGGGDARKYSDDIWNSLNHAGMGRDDNTTTRNMRSKITGTIEIIG